MADASLLLHTAIAIIGIVVIITWLRVSPVIALLVGSLYLGLVTGQGFEGTTRAVMTGFGDLMAEIGLLITFGVLLGSLLTATNALQRLIEALLRLMGPRSVPYVFSVSLSSLLTSIYSDVLLVLTAPLARRLGPRLGRHGLALMGGALTAGIEVGLVFVVPGVGALAVAGLLGVPLGAMLVFGLLVGLPTAVSTMLIYSWLTPRALRWNPALDEISDAESDAEAAERSGEAPSDELGSTGPGAAGPRSTAPEPDNRSEAPTQAFTSTSSPPLVLCLAPVVLTLLLIALGAIAEAVGRNAGLVGFFGSPVIAMFLGATSAYVLARRTLPAQEVDAAVSSGFTTAGPILVLTGISGSLAAVISGSGLDKVLAGYFSSGFLPPLLLVWLVAAVLHLAMGSISVAAITAAGILAPIAGTLDVPTVLIALAAGSGALFVPHVSSNFFWMFQTMLGLSTRGTFKAHSIPMTISSLVSLPLVLLLGLAM